MNGSHRSLLAVVALSACGTRVPTGTAQQAVNLTPSISDFVIFAEHGVRLGAHDVIAGGDVGVAMGAASTEAPQLSLSGYDIDVQGNLLAPSVALGVNANVGDVQADTLQNSGGHYRSLSAYPLNAMPVLPIAPTGSSGSMDVVVGPSDRQTLTPGNYRHLSVSGTAVLSPGVYSFSDVAVGACGNLLAMHEGVELRIAGTLVTADVVSGCPAKVAAIDENSCNGGGCSLARASTFRILVSGDDPVGGIAAHLGVRTTVQALLAAPHATLALGDEVNAHGAFAAYDVFAGNHVSFTLDGGFQASSEPHGTQQLSGYLGHPPVGSYPVLGPVSGSRPVSLAVGLPAQAGLTDLADAVSDPKSPMFRQYLTRDQFNARFGASDADYAALQQWATNAGLTITHTYSNKLLLSVSGTALQVEQALHANLVIRGTRDNTGTFVTVDREPSIDLVPQVFWISGLDDSLTLRNARGTIPACTPDTHTLSLGQSTYDYGGPGSTDNFKGLMAEDLRAAYLGLSFGPGATSPCASLTGAGQVVGVVSFEDYTASDIDEWIVRQNNAWPRPDLPVERVSVGTGFRSDSEDGESELDIEMVLAMAPKAKVKVFVGGDDLNLGADDVIAIMADDGTLTVATNSWNWRPSPNTEQSFAELAARGVSVFTSSGDNGQSEYDPGDIRDLGYQTLVGGTLLTTTLASISSPDFNATPRYCGPVIGGVKRDPFCYYGSEGTWNLGCAGTKDSTGGGIMDGSNSNTICYRELCPSKIPRPGYQHDVTSPTNGASDIYRNYPDVSIAADNLWVWKHGDLALTDGAGTSASAPLWAGFAALTNEYSEKTGHGGHVGFANPALYAVFDTRRATNDIYRQAFFDVEDGISDDNTGFPDFFVNYESVAGYDLNTGIGSPRCALIQQMGTTSPGTQQTYQTMFVHIVSGHDGVDDDSSVFLDIFANDGTEIENHEIKIAHESGWGQGTEHNVEFRLPAPYSPSDIGQLKLHLTGSDDDWDITGIQILLVPDLLQYAAAEACMVNWSGNSTCDIQQPECSSSGLLTDGNTGVMRLRAQSGSDSHPDAFFDVNPSFGDLATGCPAWGGPVNVGPTFDQLEFIADTGDDDLDSDATVEAYFVAADGSTILEHGPIHVGGSLFWDDQSEWGVPYTFQTPHALDELSAINLVMTTTATFGEEWHAQAISVYAIDSRAPWIRTCVARGFQGTDGGPEFVFNPVENPIHFLSAGSIVGTPCR